jgi:hypothetical protein
MRTAVTKAEVVDTGERLALLAQVEADVRSAGQVETLITTAGPELTVNVELAPEG